MYSAGRQPQTAQTTFYLALPIGENPLQNAGTARCWLRGNITHPGTKMVWNCLACRAKNDITSLDGMEVVTSWQTQKNIRLKRSIFNILCYKKSFWEKERERGCRAPALCGCVRIHVKKYISLLLLGTSSSLTDKKFQYFTFCLSQIRSKI